MAYILFSFAAATLLGLVAQGIYGVEAMTRQVWVDYAFWSLILGGIGAATQEWFTSLLADIRNDY